MQIRFSLSYFPVISLHTGTEAVLAHAPWLQCKREIIDIPLNLHTNILGYLTSGKKQLFYLYQQNIL